MYCKLCINCNDREKLLAILKSRFGNCKSIRNDHDFEGFSIHLMRNKEQLPNGATDNSDKFLYYPTAADLDISQNYAEITDEILHILRENNIHTVASCGYEDELKYNGFCKGELI